jgi:hypothetical protein
MMYTKPTKSSMRLHKYIKLHMYLLYKT